MEFNQNLEFTIEKVELEAPKMDIADAEGGCWGDSGSDYANIC